MSEIEFLEQNLAAQLDMEAITYKKFLIQHKSLL